MLYATFADNLLVVAAADTLAEFEDFAVRGNTVSYLYESFEVPELDELLTSPRFAGFTEVPIAVTFSDVDALAVYRTTFVIRLVEHNALIDLQKAMATPAGATIYGGPVFTTAPGSDDEKTIGEITGLDTSDRWDKRSDEQKLKDAVMKRFEEEMGKAVAEKKAAAAAEKAAGGKDIMGEAQGEEDETPEIPIELDEVPEALRTRRSFYRMEVTGADVAAVDAHVEQIDTGFILSNIALHAEDVAADACRFDFARLPAVMFAVDALKDMPDVVVTAHSVHRCVAEGGFAKVAIAIKDEVEADEIPPRPWNARGAEFAMMTPEELEENRKGMKAEEFVIAGTERADGCIVHITPDSYFEEHGEPWPDALDIAHLLPPEYVETAPGTYFVKGKNYINVNFELCNRRKFGESLMLKAYLNGL